MSNQRRRVLGPAVLAAAAVLLVTGIGTARAQVELPIEEPPVPVGADGPGGAEPRGSAATQAGTELEGLFRLAAGQCGSGAGVETGSWFRMVDPNGGYVENNDSPCDDRTWTPLSPGRDGGLVAGDYQPHPDPAFTGEGHAQADRIMEPQSFFGTRFSVATSPVDPQTGVEVGAPRLAHDGSGGLSGDLRAFGAAWNGQHFNQGSPKPDGSRPAGTEGPEGTYDDASGAYAVEWRSLIQGGPFNNFTGVWHLEGTFEGRSAGPGGPTPGSSSSGGGTQAGGASVTAPGSRASGDPLASTGGSTAGTAVLVLLGAGVLAGRVARRRSP